ncbi:hypothetical protein TURU_033059 [Turdus rufiventris]|nr:hypothetical protein TURU_033059 [Turdus rufiventris]
MIFEGIRGPGIEGDIAIDDVSIVEGECMKSDQPANSECLFPSFPPASHTELFQQDTAALVTGRFKLEFLGNALLRWIYDQVLLGL